MESGRVDLPGEQPEQSALEESGQPAREVGEAETNELTRYFRANRGKVLHKWSHYFDVYDDHFRRFRHTNPVILEIGVSHGGSLEMWRHYFGRNAKIYGIDVNPRCKELEGDGVEIFIGSQSDRAFLRSVAARVPPIDILIDDGDTG